VRRTTISTPAWTTSAADLCAAAEPQLGSQRGRAPGRLTAVVDGVRVVANPQVDQPWATTAYAMDGYPGRATLHSVCSWLSTHAAGSYSVVTRARHRSDPRWADHTLEPWEDEPVFAATVEDAAALSYPTPVAVDICAPRDVEEFWLGYGCWMPGLDAKAIVPQPLYERTDWDFLVARVDDEPVGSAIVRWADGLGYLGGIGVREDVRGRGIGGGLTAAATRLAARGRAGDGRDAGGRRIDLVWMHASTEGAPMYARLGFTEVDTHTILAYGALPTA